MLQCIWLKWPYCSHVTSRGVLAPLRIEIKRRGEIVLQKERFIKAKIWCTKEAYSEREWMWLPKIYWHFHRLVGLGAEFPLSEERNIHKLSWNRVEISKNWVVTSFFLSYISCTRSIMVLGGMLLSMVMRTDQPENTYANWWASVVLRIFRKSD